VSGFRLVVADLTGRIVADCKCDGDAVRWSGVDLAAGLEAVVAAMPVLRSKVEGLTAKVEGLKQEGDL
jgi:hypothetical protein